jgi:NAD(P)-dependent dehydrogenase (short-subunit alcohol dehydrogenase family)
VNLSNVVATLGSTCQYVDYATSKGAMDTFTIGLARAVAADDVHEMRCATASSTPRFTPPVVSSSVRSSLQQ